MDSRNSSIVGWLAALVLLVALLTAPAAGAQDTGPNGSNVGKITHSGGNP